MLPVEAVVLSFGAGTTTALAAVPIAARIARRTGFLDQPAGYKKARSSHAIPGWLGGRARSVEPRTRLPSSCNGKSADFP